MALCASGLRIRPLVITVHSVFGHPLQFLPLDLCIRTSCVANVWHFRYPTREGSFRTHAENLASLIREVRGYSHFAPVHFVTHGAGALVLRAAFRFVDFDANEGCKVVMLAPCNQGSSLARELADYGWDCVLLRSTLLRELAALNPTTMEQAFPPLPRTLKPLVIAGTLGWNPLLHGRNDGRLALEETALPGTYMRSTVRAPHSLMLLSPAAIWKTTRFLKHGSL